MNFLSQMRSGNKSCSVQCAANTHLPPPPRAAPPAQQRTSMGPPLPTSNRAPAGALPISFSASQGAGCSTESSGGTAHSSSTASYSASMPGGDQPHVPAGMHGEKKQPWPAVSNACGSPTCGCGFVCGRTSQPSQARRSIAVPEVVSQPSNPRRNRQCLLSHHMPAHTTCFTCRQTHGEARRRHLHTTPNHRHNPTNARKTQAGCSAADASAAVMTTEAATCATAGARKQPMQKSYRRKCMRRG